MALRVDILCVVGAGEGAAADGHGLVTVGTRALNESGRVGDWQRPQIELFCISKLIHCLLEADEEFVCMDLHFAVGDLPHHHISPPRVPRQWAALQGPLMQQVATCKAAAVKTRALFPICRLSGTTSESPVALAGVRDADLVADAGCVEAGGVAPAVQATMGWRRCSKWRICFWRCRRGRWMRWSARSRCTCLTTAPCPRAWSEPPRIAS